MPVSVQCPTCGQELLAAEELVGKLASCPHCQTQFPVTKSTARPTDGMQTSDSRQAVAAPSTAGSVPIAKPLNLRTAPSMLQAPSDPAKPPPVAPTIDKQSETLSAVLAPGSQPAETPSAPRGQRVLPVSAVPPAPPASPASLPNASLYPPGQSPHPAAAPTATPTAPAAAKAPQRSSSKPSREARPARFIAADASETRVELGQDGQLPVLRLEEATRANADPRTTQNSNPWLLVAAIVVSFGASAALLFVDVNRAPTERETKRLARNAIELHYSAPATQPQPYRQLLREALQAYNKGDYAAERRRYKRVLDLLHAENKDPLTGLTGQVSAAKPPYDRHLEELLSTLVDD